MISDSGASVGEKAVKAFCPGIYPRSEALVQATRDLDRGRTDPAAVDEQFRRDFDAFVALQEEAGLDLLADGMLRWQDLFRGLVERSGGLEARAITRFLDTNTFYRAVLVEGAPRLREPVPAPDLPADRWIATLPSPFAFSRATAGAASAQTLAADVLAPQIDAYEGAGCHLVVLTEPFLAREPAAIGELVTALRELPERLPLVLQLSFGDASSLLYELGELPLAGVGVDFYATPLEGVPQQLPFWLVAGVIDARSSVLEDPSALERFIEALAEREPRRIALSPNGDLQFVSERIAREKVLRLGRAAHSASHSSRDEVVASLRSPEGGQ